MIQNGSEQLYIIETTKEDATKVPNEKRVKKIDCKHLDTTINKYNPSLYLYLPLNARHAVK